MSASPQETRCDRGRRSFPCLGRRRGAKMGRPPLMLGLTGSSVSSRGARRKRVTPEDVVPLCTAWPWTQTTVDPRNPTADEANEANEANDEGG